jgi:hypothetical protein
MVLDECGRNGTLRMHDPQAVVDWKRKEPQTRILIDEVLDGR